VLRKEPWSLNHAALMI